MPDLTPSETLRAAAARLRELANAATPGPWRTAALRDDDPAYGMDVEPSVAVGNDSSGACDLADATWIATMSPSVAEPLAAWLETEIELDEPDGPLFSAALAFARTILEQP